MPGLVPIRWFCRLTEEEVDEAVMTAYEAKGRKKPPNRAQLLKIFEDADALLRNPSFDPFIVRGTAFEVGEGEGFRIGGGSGSAPPRK